MAIMTVVSIALGLTCAVVDLCAAILGDKSPLHRAAHLAFGLVFMGLVYVIWMMR